MHRAAAAPPAIEQIALVEGVDADGASVALLGHMLRHRAAEDHPSNVAALVPPAADQRANGAVGLSRLLRLQPHAQAQPDARWEDDKEQRRVGLHERAPLQRDFDPPERRFEGRLQCGEAMCVEPAGKQQQRIGNVEKADVRTLQSQRRDDRTRREDEDEYENANLMRGADERRKCHRGWCV